MNKRLLSFGVVLLILVFFVLLHVPHDCNAVDLFEAYQIAYAEALNWDTYPLVRVLRIDPNEIFYPEMSAESSVKHQLRVLIDNCSDEEAAALLVTSETILNVLRSKDATKIEEKKSLSPL